MMCVFFFFQAEDGIRDLTVTGVQTCALPILVPSRWGPGVSRTATRVRPAMAGTASRASKARFSMGRNIAARGSRVSPLAFSANERAHLPSHPAHSLGSRVVLAARRVSGAPRARAGRRARAADGRPRIPQLPARRPDGAGGRLPARPPGPRRSEEHTSELQSQSNLVCRLLLEK